MKTLERHIDRIDKKLQTVQQVRFTSGIFFLILLIAGGIMKWDAVTLISTCYWIFIFPILVRRVNKIVVFKKVLEAKQVFLERQRLKKTGKTQILAGVHSTEEARELLLVGPYSLFSYLNETWTLEGEAKLKSQLENPTDDLESILRTQGDVEKLSRYTHILQKILFRYSATENQKISLEKVENEIHSLPSKTFLLWAYVGLIVWATAVITTVLVQLKVLESVFFNIWFVYLGILIICYNKYGSFFFKSLSLYSSLRILKHLLKVLDKTKNSVFESLLPKTTQSKPHVDFQKLELVMNFLSVESHILVNVLVNLISPYYFLVGSLFVYRANKIKVNFPDFAKEIVHLDYLSNFVYLYSYHTQQFPRFHKEFSIRGEEVFIPLISHEKVQRNSFEIKKENSLNVLMGSNMSGKSTFLRTLAINQTLAQLGAPVFAKSYETFVAKLQSCILIEDSIENSISYFMKEVKRLKKIFFEVKANDGTLFLIDELFKGTNPKERLIAARSYLTEIAKFNSIGVVTTHDPELGFLEEENRNFKSWHMEDYILKEGPATSTNALEILRKEGLPVFE